MKKTHTFKNYEVAGIEGTYNMKVKVSHWKLIIECNGDQTKYQLEKESQGITKEEALKYIEQFMEMSIELEEI